MCIFINICGGEWKAETTRINSLRLLSLDPDRIGEAFARSNLPERNMAGFGPAFKPGVKTVESYRHSVKGLPERVNTENGVHQRNIIKISHVM